MKTENLSKTREFFFHQNGINEKRSIVDEERKLKLSSMFLYPKFAFLQSQHICYQNVISKLFLKTPCRFSANH